MAIAEEFGFVVLTRDSSMDIGQIVEQSPALSSNSVLLHSITLFSSLPASLRSEVLINAQLGGGRTC